MKENLNGKWMLNGEDNEYWDACDRFDSKEEAVKHGIELLKKYNASSNREKEVIDLGDTLNIIPQDYDPIFSFDVGQIVKPGISIDPDLILEGVAESVYDECGEFAEGYLSDVTKEHEKELEDLIFSWFEKHDYFPSCFLIQNVETINLNVFGDQPPC